MPAKSKAQQKAAGAALAAKRGETSKSRLRDASRQMVETMSEKELREMASTSRKGKPARVSEKSSAGTKKRAAKKAGGRTKS